MIGPAPSARLTTALQGLRRRPRALLVALAALAFALALLRPGITLPGRAGTTLLVVDITQSMNVEDMAATGPGTPASAAAQTRLAYTRELLRRALRELPCGHRIGVGVFAERKTMVLVAPLEVCAHYGALDDVLDGIDWRMAWAADSHLYYGSYSALDEIERRWPGAALALFTDGDQAPALAAGREPRFERRPTTPPGLLFGIGGELPQPVPRLDADGRITGYWTADEAAAFASSGGPTLSVLDMERMAAGQDVRNAPQRAPGSTAQHLSARRDAVLQDVARVTGLGVGDPGSAGAVVAALRALPGGRAVARRHELHDALAVLGVLALLASLLPLPRRRPAGAQAAPPPAPAPPTPSIPNPHPTLEPEPT